MAENMVEVEEIDGIVMEADQMYVPTLDENCAEIYRLRDEKKALEERISKLEKTVRKQLSDLKVSDYIAGNLSVHIKVTPPTLIVDTAKLKENGLFEKYSKQKAGYESLMITESSENAV